MLYRFLVPASLLLLSLVGCEPAKEPGNVEPQQDPAPRPTVAFLRVDREPRGIFNDDRPIILFRVTNPTAEPLGYYGASASANPEEPRPTQHRRQAWKGGKWTEDFRTYCAAGSSYQVLQPGDSVDFPLIDWREARRIRVGVHLYPNGTHDFERSALVWSRGYTIRE